MAPPATTKTSVDSKSGKLPSSYALYGSDVAQSRNQLDELNAAKALLHARTAVERAAAAHQLSDRAPTSETMAAILAAAVHDPVDEVRRAAKVALEIWRGADGTADGMINGLLKLVCGPPVPANRPANVFQFNGSLIYVIISPATVDRETRIAAASERIRGIVADLPNIAERREAEVNALISSVPATSPYPDQIREFTGITHAMRVMMVRQLEPRFREHLRDESPKEDPSISDRDERRTRLASGKQLFSEQITNQVFALGLAPRWGGLPCHLTGTKTARNPLGEYRVIPCRATKPVCYPANWTENFISQIGLMDAAEPGKNNCLSPVRTK